MLAGKTYKAHQLVKGKQEKYYTDTNQKEIPIKKHGYKQQSFFRRGLDLLDECIKHITEKFEELIYYINLTVRELQRNYCFYMFRKKGFNVSNLKIVG